MKGKQATRRRDDDEGNRHNARIGSTVSFHVPPDSTTARMFRHCKRNVLQLSTIYLRTTAATVE